MSQAPQVRRIGPRIFVANVLPVTEDGVLLEGADIEQQTHAVFRGLRRSLAGAGAELADLVRINTCYVYAGAEGSATPYWERMTRVRLEYFPDPGPVGTAVRFGGTCARGATIQLEAEALEPAMRNRRRRIMPAASWDWSIPLPLSQGWRLEDYVWVGGQISADKRGRAVHKGDLRAQTEAVMQYIFDVLKDAGARREDLLHLKVCYLHDGDHAAAEERLAQIMDTMRAACGGSLPAVTAFGVNLLYDGLLLEIDAAAVTAGNPVATHAGMRRGAYFHVGGRSAPARASLEETCAASLNECLEAAGELGGSSDSVGRMMLLVSKKSLGARSACELHGIVASHFAAGRIPATTIAVVEGLPAGADVQVDAFGVAGK
jgi:enamine deaminase RidA (YjgF/YER057c/UK114 family)